MTGSLIAHESIMNMYEVKLGNDGKVKVNGKGVIVVYAKNGKRRTIHDVYYVPGLMCDLLSVGQFLEKEYIVFFKKKVCIIYDKYPSKQLIARVEMTQNIMFLLIMRNDLTNSLNAYKTKSLDQSLLWNLRYGHLHFGGLELLQKKQMVKGLPSIVQPIGSCEVAY